ncbi:MAG: thymidine kinase [Candidatus Magasanikbacteria bacterium CG11_big_fil_rev_8_21_14_0_20_39_34]|uniref:Thymidine kinase n=1 Tax=Candidatus Magasanikbacteria bacterium CG11_big_fil_rev_8_21_14_0_20_39_34 TaxID=1974653 RepID=A0A2H0N4C1_9BACT|nr:MAG: thymidine kinase [Candidatus Magasanikbacteria bacterium CG11_big_fil_rev_8_21_14_0_20_39_34]
MIPHTHPTSGWIEVVCGSMFSGKTEELLRRVKRVHYAKQQVQVFKPVTDNRYDANDVVAHDGVKIEGIALDQPHHMLYLLHQNTKVVGIDEIHFFDENIVPVVQSLADRGIRVICAGLDQNYQGRPFGPMPTLLSLAEYVTKLHAICEKCGAPGTRTQKTGGSEQEVEVGEKDMYQARCRACHHSGIDQLENARQAEFPLQILPFFQVNIVDKREEN